MAQATLHPERVVGLHFFNPVPKMPLVEVVRAAQSDDASLATAVAPGRSHGQDARARQRFPGFLVNRILVPYLAEALVMAGEGYPSAPSTTRHERWGMPMGPFELLDEIGLDIAWHVLSVPRRRAAIRDRGRGHGAGDAGTTGWARRAGGVLHLRPAPAARPRPASIAELSRCCPAEARQTAPRCRIDPVAARPAHGQRVPRECWKKASWTRPIPSTWRRCWDWVWRPSAAGSCRSPRRAGSGQRDGPTAAQPRRRRRACRAHVTGRAARMPTFTRADQEQFEKARDLLETAPPKETGLRQVAVLRPARADQILPYPRQDPGRGAPHGRTDGAVSTRSSRPRSIPTASMPRSASRST